MRKPVARAQVTLRAAVCLVATLAGLTLGGVLLWHVMFVKFNGLIGLTAASLLGGSIAVLYCDYIEPLFYDLPPRGPDGL